MRSCQSTYGYRCKSQQFLSGFLLSWVLVILLSCGQKPASPSIVSESAKDTLSLVWPARFDPDSARILSALSGMGMHPFASSVREFYENTGYSFVWFHPDGYSAGLELFLDRLDAAGASDVGHNRFAAESIRKELCALKDDFPLLQPTDRLAALDVAITCAWFHYADSAFVGLPDRKRHQLQWFLPDRRVDAAELLEQFLSDTLHPDDFNPLHVQYGRMSEALQRLNEMDAAAWSEPFDEEHPLDLLFDSLSVHRIRERLVQLGDLDAGTFGKGGMMEALRRFRVRHGLGDEAALDAATVRELNVSPVARIRQLLVNMERCKWLPDADSGRFIVVNVPDFRLGFFNGDSMIWSCGVVVGKSETPTAVFSGNISEVVFNPYWIVPKSILKEELLPEFKEDPSRFVRSHYEVVTRTRPPRIVQGPFNWDSIDVDRFPFDVRQMPGPWNPLGRIKFVFPNSFDMYLHDTPAKELFGKKTRAFSHGCIRVEDPEGLLGLIAEGESQLNMLKDRPWISSRAETRFSLSHAVPVYIVYLTAWVDKNGLNFRRDVYGHDAKLHKELFNSD